MRGKRSKQYRKLMEQYSMTFGFREPYQVLVDAEMIRDSCRFKMELAPALQRTVHGVVKPMITQCEIRKLYAAKNEPGVSEAIDVAKNFERRRCGHHPDEYEKPLEVTECMAEVIDPKNTGQNKHRYVVASQSQDLRRLLRSVRGVPLIYIKRSVMILEPMADESAQLRAREERNKFRAEIKKKNLGKRKRDENDDEGDGEGGGADKDAKATKKSKDKAKHGAKGPNPLSVKKAAKKRDDGPAKKEQTAEVGEPSSEGTGKRKRRRKTKQSGAADGDGDAGAGTTSAAAAAVPEEEDRGSVQCPSGV